MNDIVGRRGESRFTLLITAMQDDGRPLFRAQPLGDKWPTVDFVVELLGCDGIQPFFFVQVKTTRQGYTERERRLRVSVPERTVGALAALPAPAYLVGIDDVDGTGYIVSANGERQAAVSSLATTFPIDGDTRARLWREVAGFWRSRQALPFSSEFTDLAGE